MTDMPLEEYRITVEDVQNGKAMAAVSYLGLVGFLVGFLTSRENRFVLYHCQQSLVLVLAWMVSGFILMFSVIPLIGLIILVLFWLFIGVPLVVLLIIGIVNAAGGEVKPLPVIGKLGLRFGLLKPWTAGSVA